MAALTAWTAASRTSSSGRPLRASSRRVSRSEPQPRCSAGRCAICRSGFTASSAAHPVTSADVANYGIGVCWLRRVAMALRVKGKAADPLRYLVSVSDLRRQMFLDQIDEPVRRSIAAQLKLDLKLVSLTLASSTVDRSLRQRGRIAKLAVVEDYIQRHQHVGDLTSKHGYFAAHAEMDWKPLDDNETVLFCGYAGTLLVVLGGSISHLVGRSSAPMQIGSHPHTIQAAVLYGDEPRDLGRDLEATAQEVCSTPQP